MGQRHALPDLVLQISYFSIDLGGACLRGDPQTLRATMKASSEVGRVSLLLSRCQSLRYAL